MANIVSQMAGIPANWVEMTPEQRRQWRLNKFLGAEGIKFINAEAQQNYHIRAKRIVDVLNIQEPDRVPVNISAGNLPYTMYGISARTAMYDCAQAVESCKQFNAKYSAELETFASPSMPAGRIMEMLGYNLYSWAGRGLPMSAPGVQFLESEYMKADEYDDFIRDPSDFWLRTYLPRVFSVLEPLRMFQTPTSIIEILSVAQFTPLANPEMQETLLKLVEIGREFQRMSQVLGPYSGMGPASGYPFGWGGNFAKAPFDTLGDTLRGTAAIMKDMYRRPDKILEACDKIADLTIASILKSPAANANFMVTYPLHKGADGWMSQKQFETLYWPSFKKVMDAFVEQGFIQSLFAEGSFNTRLEYFKEMPKGSINWLFDQTDMQRAKQMLGDKFSIQGNIPASLMVTSTAKDVKEYCRKLIEVCGKGGGYTLALGCQAENPKLDNLRAVIAAANEYGFYRKSG